MLRRTNDEIWGHLERIAKYFPEDRWVQVRTVVLGNVQSALVFSSTKTRALRGELNRWLFPIFERESWWKHLPFSTHRHREGRHDLRPTGASEKGIAMPILVVATNELPELHATDPS
jgi:hypothetical protein